MIWLIMFATGIFTFGTRFIMLNRVAERELPSWLVEACATLDPRDVDEVVTLLRRAAKNAEAHGEPGASCPANPKDAAAYVFEQERRLGWHEHDASAREDAFPRGAAAAPGSRDAPTTAQHRARWSRAPSDEWWLASAGEAGFVRVQRFDATWAERRLEQLERLHAPAAARNKECEEKNGL